MFFSIESLFFIVYLAITLRMLCEQIYFGYLLHKRRALVFAPFICACVINLLRWPYLALRYPKIFVAEILLGKRPNLKTQQAKSAHIEKILRQGKDNNEYE